MKHKGKILFVDNDAQAAESYEKYLTIVGEYQVTVATADESAESTDDSVESTIDVARKLLDKWFHVAIVDKRLVNDFDPGDRSGFALIEESDPVIPKIVLTVEEEWRTVRDALSSQGVVAYLTKRELREATFSLLVEKIEEVFTVHRVMNRGLAFEYGGTSFPCMTSLINAGPDEGEQLILWADELQDLFRKLFHACTQITLFPLQYRGRGKTVLVQVKPIGEGGEQRRVIIKCGIREHIRQEVENFEKFVRPFAGAWSTQKEYYDETLHFGGVGYSIVQGSIEQTERFLDFYRGVREAPPIKKVLDHLFTETCVRWYQGKRHPSHIGLDSYYLQLLSLDDPSKRAELEEWTRTICREASRSLQVQRIQQDRGSIIFELGDDSFSFPDPTRYIYSGSLAFPQSFSQCITHGDLNGNNILVDERSHAAWIIDFERTGFGPAGRDFAELEGVIRWELVRMRNFAQLLRVEKSLIAPLQFTDRIEEIDATTDGLRLAVEVIDHLRQLAGQLSAGSLRAYYVGLLFYAVQMIVLGGITSPAQGRPSLVRRAHALLSAAMICEKLEELATVDQDVSGPETRIR